MTAVSKHAQPGRTASPARAEEKKSYCSKLFTHQTSWNGLKSYLTAAIINVSYRAPALDQRAAFTMYDKERKKCIIQDAISVEDISELSYAAITRISLKKV